MAAVPCEGFTILESRADEAPAVHVPPDQFLCADCTAELADPQDRRFRYPFINCTQCGPRCTLIRALPYDRCNTTMATFDLCPRCAAEYRDPTNRRFHAEPVACPDCGPNWLSAARRRVCRAQRRSRLRSMPCGPAISSQSRELAATI